MRPCIYISGPMTGYPDLNFPAFNRAADALRKVGFPVINPADFGVQPGETWAECLKRDVHVLVSCQQVVTLDDWEQSKGARLECHIAVELGIPVTSLVEFALGIKPCSTSSPGISQDSSDTDSDTSSPGSLSPIDSGPDMPPLAGTKTTDEPDRDEYDVSPTYGTSGWYMEWLKTQTVAEFEHHAFN